ncbi:hypothetical protein HUA76_14320 [Myxococcus sp. CA056]|uniref:alpha/beta hydrolase n=1 Tax=Myxococcus sp. CA056 TaxID=2741740 RepID=UPI00157B0F3C|nr:alpha/beta hydrolase [Myxococcus sp. CA056]NTX11972.1 hypothetical protein [Myxococcus sp. CA056]
MAGVPSVGGNTAESTRKRMEVARKAQADQGARTEKARPKTKPMEFTSAYEGPKKTGAEKLTGETSKAPGTPVPEAPSDPKARAGWWKGLSPAQRNQAIASDPKKIGSLDGLPAVARDAANRTQLRNELTQLNTEGEKAKADFLKSPSLRPLDRTLATNQPVENFLSEQKRNQLKNARAVEGQLNRLTSEKVPSQLLVYDSSFVKGEGRAAIVAGNLDTARHVALSVPGLSSDVRDDIDNLTTDALRLRRAAADKKDDVASIAWMGYDAPTPSNVAVDNAAHNGARLLASDVAGIQASRSDNPPHLTVIGHSYGSTTASIAADKHGLQADDLVLIGSPGAGTAKTVKDYDPKLSNGHVWSGSASTDRVTWANGSNIPGDPLGQDPTEDKFGAQRFIAEAGNPDSIFNPLRDHSQYYDPGTQSLNNLVDIVTGNFNGVERARHRYSYRDRYSRHRVADPEAKRPR